MFSNSKKRRDGYYKKHYIKKTDYKHHSEKKNAFLFKKRKEKTLADVSPKLGYFKGTPFDSFFEVIYFLYVKVVKKKSICRNLDMFLTYYDNDGKLHKFYPDFIENGRYFVEVKGKFTERDIQKRIQNPRVKFIVPKDISEMKKALKEKGIDLDKVLKDNFV